MLSNLVTQTVFSKTNPKLYRNEQEGVDVAAGVTGDGDGYVERLLQRLNGRIDSLVIFTTNLGIG